MTDKKQYLSKESFDNLKEEYIKVKEEKIPEIAKKIDEAKQLGDLSENAEYHQAKEDMAWAQGRLAEIQQIIDNAEIIEKNLDTSQVVLGSTVEIDFDGNKKEYSIVGEQEADPLNGKISNESPIGEALLGAKKGEKIEVKTPGGVKIYKILKIT